MLITLFWYICPELVLNGHICCAIPPLFRITTKKNEYIFLRDQRALEKYKEAHNNEKFQVNRNKGLGEMDAHELEQTLLNPSTRNIAQIIVSDKEKSNNMIKIFMGKETNERKEYIAKHSEEAKV